MNDARRIELSGEDTGRWLVETISGSLHIFDLDEMTYQRHGLEPFNFDGLTETADNPILEVDQMPRINSPFQLAVAAKEPGMETYLTSSYVVRITALGEHDTIAKAAPALNVLETVAQAPPANAWLLMGDGASYPTLAELEAQRDPDDPDDCMWTCPRQIQRGDLVFIYFVAPRSAVHFVARALDAPVYDPTIKVNALRSVDRHQWWTNLSPLVEVPSVAFQKLQELNGGYLNLKGKPTTYLTPDIVDQIIAGLGDLNDEQHLTLQHPVGDPELPEDPKQMDLADLRRIAAGRLSPEAKVEEYVSEPLLRLCFTEHDGYRVTRQVKIPGAGVADYGVYDATSDDLIGVVEVKIGIRRRPGGRIEGSPDLDQALRYATTADVPGLLIDANDIFLVQPGTDVPVGRYERIHLTQQHLNAIAVHFEDPPA